MSRNRAQPVITLHVFGTFLVILVALLSCWVTFSAAMTGNLPFYTRNLLGAVFIAIASACCCWAINGLWAQLNDHSR